MQLTLFTKQLFEDFVTPSLSFENRQLDPAGTRLTGFKIEQKCFSKKLWKFDVFILLIFEDEFKFELDLVGKVCLNN